ncbi:methylmalonyl-CoA epimerase, mitochondrial [Pristis pectinata]|uniref:methylmalonyl-CoA epimerase, mitochondrial n=1 Tax=Pristis pectinata TaxID=685728 RepID=UPI00223CD83D|nr:methylmalonyl-CoA epimerase, mitochondrial [Pristis pectinata]
MAAVWALKVARALSSGVRGARALSSGVPGSPWQLGRLSHVAVAVPEMESARAFYRDVLGGRVGEPLALPDHGVRAAFVELGGARLELLEPLGDGSPILGFLRRNPAGGLHHICLEVDRLAAALQQLRARGVRTLSPQPRLGAHGKPVIFLHPKDCGGVLLELEEA